MTAVNIGNFVRSIENDLGVGKLRDRTGAVATVEYFIGPASPLQVVETPVACLTPETLPPETRVYVQSESGGTWVEGRVVTDHSNGRAYFIKVPNSSEPVVAPIDRLFTRCDLPLPDPTTFLAERITETPFFFERRAKLVDAEIEQRHACAGVTALLASSMDLETYQIEVARRVLHDSVQRYLLADEVGLGKTIEAGVIIRQFVLDHPRDHEVLVLVPSHLVSQWRAELSDRFRLAPLLDASVRIFSHEDAPLDRIERAGLVVVDEAHHVAQWATEGEDQFVRFLALRDLVASPSVRLLLLSATPTLHSDRAGYHALFHLLDPALYALDDRAGFQERLKRHQAVARLYYEFQPGEDGGYLESALDSLAEHFPRDERLAALADDLRPMLAFGAVYDDAERARLVRAVRTHVSETYRLHRRLLRTRRADGRVRGLLRGRDGLETWTYRDDAAVRLFQLLDDWRLAAAAASRPDDHAAYGRLVGEFSAAAHDPEALANRVSSVLDLRRRPAAAQTADEAVWSTAVADDEHAALERLRDAAARSGESSRSEDRRIAALIFELDRLFRGSNCQAVVFASGEGCARRVCAALHARWPGRVFRHGDGAARHFRGRGNANSILVCDRGAEEGLNLHGGDAVMIHYDVPWSPNRVEQRIGRLDRYGGGKVRSFALLAAGDELAAAWLEHLDLGYRVFDQSIASLQYFIDDECRSLAERLARCGHEAIVESTRRLAGEEGREGAVARALLDIQVMDELDAVEAPLGHEGFAANLRRVDGERWPDWEEAVRVWACELLRFGRRYEGPSNSPVMRYQFRRPRDGGGTLMPVDRLVRHFAHVLDRTDDDATRDGPLTYPLTFDRGEAQRRKVALARVGDPFLDALHEYARWDDRGTCTAFWRFRPGKPYRRPAELAYQFRFVVECRLDAALAEARAVGRADETHAIRRQADWLLPPLVVPVWLDEDFGLISDRVRLAALNEPYLKESRFNPARDFNLNAARWEVVRSHYPAVGWKTTVVAARDRAEKILRDSSRWRGLMDDRAAAAEQALAELAEMACSRLAFLDEHRRDAERRLLRGDARILKALTAGVREPIVRIDSVAAVFLADWNPFSGDAE